MVDYTINDFNVRELGNFYHQDKTIFRVFAPEYDRLFLFIGENSYEMHRNNYCFEIALAGDLEYVRYHYLAQGIAFKDPFAYVSIGEESVVVNPEKFMKESIVPDIARKTIIYEASVRDFSSDDSYPGNLKSKFLSFTESGLKAANIYSAGLDYLVELGISHLQLLPVFDYDNDNSDYNWGYNPIAYNYVKSDYLMDPNDPYAYINELRTMVNTLHKNNIRVVLDVVFNHVYNAAKNDLELMVPGHIFRYKPDGTLAEGTFCGNEVKTEDVFVREYLCEMVRRYIDLFDIDGLRFDLMGIMDYETINRIRETAQSIKKDFIMYGEGWNMGDVLPEDQRASIRNYRSLPGTGMFSDHFRDVIIKFVSGDQSLKHEVMKALACDPSYLDANHSINYVECHDGYTMFDHMFRYLGDNVQTNESRSKLALALVLLSRGTPFIHMGQEFLRSKKGIKNSYSCDDSINAIDWNLRVKHQDSVEYLKQLIMFRKRHDSFTASDVKISFEDFYGGLVFKLDNLMIIINADENDHMYNSDGNELHIIFDKNGPSEYYASILNVPAFSIVICKL